MTILWHTGSAPLTNRGHIIHHPPLKKTFFCLLLRYGTSTFAPEKEDKITPKTQEKEDNKIHKPRIKEDK